MFSSFWSVILLKSRKVISYVGIREVEYLSATALKLFEFSLEDDFLVLTFPGDFVKSCDQLLVQIVYLVAFMGHLIEGCLQLGNLFILPFDLSF